MNIMVKNQKQKVKSKKYISNKYRNQNYNHQKTKFFILNIVIYLLRFVKNDFNENYSTINKI